MHLLDLTDEHVGHVVQRPCHLRAKFSSPAVLPKRRASKRRQRKPPHSRLGGPPPGQTKYLILQGADDQIAPPENGVLLQQELGGRATLINVPGAGHLLPLEKTQTTASHMISFIRQLDGKS